MSSRKVAEKSLHKMQLFFAHVRTRRAITLAAASNRWAHPARMETRDLRSQAQLRPNYVEVRLESEPVKEMSAIYGWDGIRP
jgi:hypothetical protein